MKKILSALITAVIVCMICTACYKPKEIKFDDSDPLALVTGIEWAVLVPPYAAFREEPGFENKIIAEGKKAEIHRVTGKRILQTVSGRKKEYTVWYKFEEGWLDESVVEIYNNKYKAQTASAKMLSGKN